MLVVVLSDIRAYWSRTSDGKVGYGLGLRIRGQDRAPFSNVGGCFLVASEIVLACIYDVAAIRLNTDWFRQPSGAFYLFFR